MSKFYCLAAPDSDRLLAAGDLASTPGARPCPPCPTNPNHGHCVTPETDEQVDAPVILDVRHNTRGQLLIWSWPPWPCVAFHNSLLQKMHEAGFTGYELRPATVRFRDGLLTHDYQRLQVTGWGGLANPESGIRLMKACPGCLYKSYSSLSDSSTLIDRSQWTGEDFFMVWPLQYYIFVTERIAEFLRVGIYLTQVAPICSMAGCGGISAQSERVRGLV